MREPVKNIQWRVRGERENYGPWTGAWKDTPPRRWDVEQYQKNNDSVIVECREVWEYPPVVVTLEDLA